MNKTIVVAVVLALAVGIFAWLAARRGPTPLPQPEENLVSRSIGIVAEGAVLHYQENLVWAEDQFLKILGDQDGFRMAQISRFNEFYHVSADNFSVEFNEEGRLTILRCGVHGQLKGDWYDFHWLLNPLGLDLIDSHFIKSDKELCWSGVIEGVPTTIVLRFPFVIDHCHAHVWQKR